MPWWLLKIVPTISKYLFGWWSKRSQDKKDIELKSAKHEIWVKTMEVQAKEHANKKINNTTDYLDKP
jgi:hypothetical protein|tara:strand:- start:4888 stop:5088 length:201 start_codon:yes stop_codon:yes gene_type:complete